MDAPQAAVTGAQTLVSAVMEDRGYPTQPYDQTVADLSVEHAATLGHFRAAEQTSRNAAAGTASTEDLRLAMIDYRAMFRDLVGEPAEAANGSSATEPALATGARDVRVSDTQPDMAVADPVADGPGDQLSRTNAGS